MSIKVHIPSAQGTLVAHAKRGWQCPECFGVRIKTYEDRFTIKADRFECQECGCTWHREA